MWICLINTRILASWDPLVPCQTLHVVDQHLNARFRRTCLYLRCLVFRLDSTWDLKRTCFQGLIAHCQVFEVSKLFSWRVETLRLSNLLILLLKDPAFRSQRFGSRLFVKRLIECLHHQVDWVQLMNRNRKVCFVNKYLSWTSSLFEVELFC